MGERRLLVTSVNTKRAMARPRPRLRGLSHLGAAVVAIPGSLIWIVLVPHGRARAAVAAFALGIAIMFTCSALLHLRGWSLATYERLLRLDHTGIYLAIGGTGLALGLLGLDGWPGRILVAGAAIGMAIGIAVEWLPFAAPRGFNLAVYLTLGWVPLVLLPWLWQTSGVLVVVLLGIGGVFYTSGAIIVGLRRPDPLPHWFGYHEIFHVLVIAAVVSHGAMLAVLVQRSG
jgi:hemolysin III